MNLASFLGFAVQVLTVVAPRTPTKIDDEILDGVKALEQSPPFLAWLQKQIDKIGPDEPVMPPGVFTMQGPLPEDVQRETLPLLGNGLDTFAKIMPMLLELWKIYQATRAAK